jgi:DNA-binding CsgD family transcriptional regulator
VERDAEAKLRLIARVERTVGLGFFDWDLLTDRVTWSDGMYRLYGLERGRPMSLPETLAPLESEDGADVRDLIAGVLRSGGPAGFDLMLRRPDGSRRAALLHLQVTPDAAGRPVRAIGTMLDVTGQRRPESAAESERRRAQRLAQSLRAAQLTARAQMPASPQVAALSPREREVLGLIAGGLTSEEIAEALHITRHTARTHARNILDKLGARTRAHAVALALGRAPEPAPDRLAGPLGEQA